MHQRESLPVEERAISAVHPYPGNPRRITDQAIEKVAASLKEFGWRQPIVVDAEGVIIVGHTRRLAALRLGLETVPVHVAASLTPEQVRAYRLADNRTGEEAAWDLAALAVDLRALDDLGFDLSLTAFDPVELPGPPAAFEPIKADDVKRLDKRAIVTCPGCGQKFEP
jgi:ParB-like chromosome segregation protein Spo0J